MGVALGDRVALGPSERCTIVVGGGGGLVGECGVFDTHGFNDAVLCPCHPTADVLAADCPSGVARLGDAIEWVSVWEIPSSKVVVAGNCVFISEWRVHK